MIRGPNFRKNVFDKVIRFLNDFIIFSKFSLKSNCPYYLKDKPLENFKISYLKSKTRTSKMNFHQNFNLMTSLMPKISKFLNYSIVYSVTFVSVPSKKKYNGQFEQFLKN